MECVKCGHEIVEGASFCPYCGEKVASIIPGEEKPVYLAEVKGLLKSGKLVVYHDRVEFIVSNAQKTVYNYAGLVAVKKGLDRILFITEDGRTESCMVSMKNVHEAFIYIEKAARPYIEERKNRLLSEGIQYSLVSNMGLTGGILNILSDRAEFKAKSGAGEILWFKDVKSVSMSMGTLEFALLGGTFKSFTLDKDIRDEVFSFVEKAVAPYIAERKEELLSRGIYYSFLSSQGPDSGVLEILGDRVEYKVPSGQSKTIFFKDVRKAGLLMGMLELSLTDGTTRSFVVDKDVSDEVLVFVEKAIRPYVVGRTVGFETVFGIDERIEINEKRGVFHIIRQSGKEITDECPLKDVVKCEWTESSTPSSMLSGVLSGGMAILSSAAKAVGTQDGQKAEEKISYVGVLLTIGTSQGTRTECVRFGDFSLGMSRTNKKYDRYIAEISRLMDYLGSNCPECELAVPVLPAVENRSEEIVVDAVSVEEDLPAIADEITEKDEFGIIKYIEGVSRFINGCATPMTIAIQGSWGNGKNSIMKMISNSLEESYKGNLIWFNTWQFSQSDSGEQLPMLVGNRLVGQLGGTSNAATKDRAIKVAKGLINITSGFISQGSTDGQNLMDAIFKDNNSADSIEKLVKVFSELVRKRIVGESNKVIILIDDLDRLTPAKGVELLEAMRNFFDCEGCVFVIAADYNSVIRGAEERYGQDFDESRGKSFFDKLFQVSFRVPVSGQNIQNYVKEKLEQIEIYGSDEAELGIYVELIRHSTGCDPKSVERLFNSFLLLKNLADETYADKNRRLMLFALICMQTRFHGVYDLLVKMRDKMTPVFLFGLCDDQTGILGKSGLGDEEKPEFEEFYRTFCDVIDADKKGSISEAECRMFAEVLEISSITSK